MNNPPTLNPDGGDDRTVDVTEGSNITLNCTRDSNNAPGDLYQWIHPDGQMTPGAPDDAPPDSPVQVTLNNINREDNGVYICQGFRNLVPDSALKNNVTLNVQCELPVLLHVLYCVSFTQYKTELICTCLLKVIISVSICRSCKNLILHSWEHHINSKLHTSTELYL